MKRRKCMADGGIKHLAAGTVTPIRGRGTATSDSLEAIVAGDEVRLSDGEAAAILPAKTAQNRAAVAAIKGIIEATNGKPPVSGGGRYQAGIAKLDEETGNSSILPALPEGGMLATPQRRQRVAQAITDAPAIGNPLTIFGGPKPITAQQMYGSAPPPNDFQQRIIEGQGLRPDVGLTGRRAVPLQAEFSNEGRGSAVLATNYARPAPTIPVQPPVAAEASGGPSTPSLPDAAVPQTQYPGPREPIASGTGFIRNNRTGAVTPVGSPSIASPTPQPIAMPVSMAPMQAIPPAQPTDTSRYRQAAEKILLDESRGPGGGVAARLLMGLSGRAAGMDNEAVRANQSAAELASTDSYRRASLGLQGREQSVREQESADKLQDTAAQRAARAGIADAIESGDEAKIKKAQAKGIAAGVLKPTDERKHEETPYRIHTDPTSGEQMRINQKTGATDRLDRATNTWQPVGVSQPKQAPQAAIDALRSSPALAAQFQQKYGYLP